MSGTSIIAQFSMSLGHRPVNVKRAVIGSSAQYF